MVVRIGRHSFTVEQRPELRIGATDPWCIRIGGGWYQISLARRIDARAAALKFHRERMRNIPDPRPAFVASRQYPLLLVVDDVPVRVWPEFVARGRGAKTYVNPLTGDRVATTRGPMWMFETAHYAASRHLGLLSPVEGRGL